MPVEVKGLEDLSRKCRLIQANLDGAPIEKVVLEGAKIIRDQARTNVKQSMNRSSGITGRLLAAIQAVKGKKASRQGALAIARVNAYKAPHAILIEAGTKERGPGKWKAMRLFGDAIAALQASGKRGKFLKKLQAGGAIFIRRAAPVKATHFFERAVADGIGPAQKAIEDGCRRLVEESLR